MSRQQYQKLVRDKILERIAHRGGKPHARILSDTEFLVELRRKLQEEIREYLAAETPEARLEEIADIFEVITALNTAEGRSLDVVIATQMKKREERGAFTKKIFLESVEEGK